MARSTQKNSLNLAAQPGFRQALNGFLEEIPVPVLGWDVNRAIRIANSAFLKLSGFKRKELMGTRPPYPFWSQCPDDVYPETYFKTDSRSRQWRIQRKNGELLWVDISNRACPVRGESGLTISYVQDISRLKTAEAGVKQIEEKWLRIFEAMPLPVAIASVPEGLFTYVNRAFLKTGGYRREDFIGKLMPEANWQDTASLQMVSDKMDKSGNVTDVEMRLVARDGRRHVALLSSRKVKLKDQKLNIAVSMDITKMKEAEDALRQSEAFNSSLLRNAPNPILVSNLDASIRFVNPAFCKMTGFSPRELLGLKPPFPWWPKGRDSLYYEENQRAVSRELNSLERLIIKKNGEEAWISVSTRHVIEDHQIRYFLAIWTDITDRKKAEHDFVESEKFNTLLLNSSPNPILVVYPDSTIKFVNPALEKLTGFKIQDLLGTRAPYPWWPVEKTAEYMAENQNTSGQEVTRRERLFRKQNGQTFWVTMSIQPIDDGGKPRYTLANWMDVTERKQLEDNLHASYQKEKLQREELEEENRLRGHFINVLAHELRTPITPILSSTDMLKHIYEGRRDSVQKKLVENIYNSSNTLAHRLEELLDMARNARGAFKLNIQPVETGLFIQGVINRFKPTLNSLKQDLAVDMPEDLPGAELDASRLEQVFINLLSNASKFSPEKSTIKLKIEVKDSVLCVEVTDKGIGISPEGQSRLFQPYYRVEQDRHQVQGLGLGLAVSKQIVEAHGGTIGVTSEKGKGSTFGFRIPLKPVE